MALAAAVPLVAVPGGFQGCFRRLDALAVQEPGGGLGGPTGLLPQLLAQARIERLPRTIDGPLVEVVPHAGPIGEIMRQQAPSAARLLQVQECIDDLAQIQGSRATRPRLANEERLESLPLSIGQIGRVSATTGRGGHSGLRSTPAPGVLPAPHVRLTGALYNF